ncbi:hypothetical protein M9H77_02870 [Catharanthus roseus]|uniref:Uncharacterized protein n=1 Tax=Catharanthus roseus TaxID=4058 RepID=A0ACC0C9X0_CATRO|nr:hypothetical protein M9H77_02870 [Catharanthus roseus]
MVKKKNANIGREVNIEEGGSSRRRGKGKRVPSGVRAPDRFIFVKEAANFEEWTRNKRKIALGHKVYLIDIQGIEAIPNLFNMIGWVPLHTVHELYYSEMIYEFFLENIPHQWVLSRIGGRDIAFDDRLLNTILETPQDCIRFYTKNKKCFDPNLYSERRFEEIFTKGEVLKRHDDSNVNKLNAYGRLLYHMISNIIIPNAGHKSSITNMQSFFMLSLHEHRRMNVVGDHIGLGKIYNQHTFKRMGFERNEEGLLVRGGQNESDGDDDEEQEEMNVNEEERGAYHSKISFKPLACFQIYGGSYLSLMLFDILCSY